MNEELIKEFLNKRNIFAVVGASRNPKKYGYQVYKDLKEAGYTVYPVNPNADEILGTDAIQISRICQQNLMLSTLWYHRKPQKKRSRPARRSESQRFGCNPDQNLKQPSNSVMTTTLTSYTESAL